uniref:Uncharacterized protein n=1 Tax=Anopheles epiroticus TaxID=199890 RepID=A0A182PW54_9DIPT
MYFLIFVGGVMIALNVQNMFQCVQAAGDDNESLIETCSNIVQGTTEDLMAQYRVNEFPDDIVTHCFVRCLGLKLNLYNDEDGVDLQANWEHLGKADDVNEFITKHRVCLATKNLDTIEDLCDRAYSAFQCLMEDYGVDQNKTNVTS